VDDDPAIRDAVHDILELADIDTLMAANGLEAIELFTQYRDRVRAVLLDLRMPVMSGAETYHRLRQLDPAVSIILSSGYDERMAAIRVDEDDAVFFLRKPYAIDALITRVQGAID
jgi:CheY-like chemotaxis protein